MNAAPATRILTVDDNPAIHEDFRKLFAGQDHDTIALENLESLVFGAAPDREAAPTFALESAMQGQEALAKVTAAMAAGQPFALAFVDVRMPPGWDGVETVERLWKVDPDLQIVICTAYSDYSWDEMRQRLGNSDSLLVLKKPFDTVEVLQLAHALTRKWELARQVRESVRSLDRRVVERTAALAKEMAERTRAEERLRQAQKMDAVGQFAAGIAHDFNNIITVIRGHADLLLSGLDNPALSTEALRQIADGAERAASLTRQLLVFSRKAPVSPQPLDLNHILSKAGALLRRLLGANIQLRIAPADTPAVVLADETSVNQVIINLAVNARDAMSESGHLTLRLTRELVAAEVSALHATARPGHAICLAVTDTGSGMTPETISHIFEPFFTTKAAGKGTGLGLSTVYGIVQQAGGWIDVQSQPGCGTTFRIHFPECDEPVAASASTAYPFAAAQPPASQSTILLVEDEPGVRQLVRTVLEMDSHRVLEAADGVEAIRLWEQHEPEIGLLFTDMVLPNGVSGRRLIEQFRGERPDLKVLCASGYGKEAIGADWLKTAGVDYVPKPFTADSVLRAVTAALTLEAPLTGDAAARAASAL